MKFDIEIRQIEEKDVDSFCELILNMYSNLENLEWFTPMPFDKENVLTMINKPRFYIIGAFVNDRLVGVSSLDYKCGKLIGKIDFPKECNTEKLVEIGFNLVHSDFRGNKIMQLLIDYLLNYLKEKDFEWVFTKVHKDNIASLKSCYNKGFLSCIDFEKPVEKISFENLSSQDFFSEIGKKNAKDTLKKFKNSEEIVVNYKILLKNLKDNLIK